jgi:acetyltransferase-like isoleucine patch superfamily enzyme
MMKSVFRKSPKNILNILNNFNRYSMNNTNLNRLLRMLPNFLWPLKLYLMKNAFQSVGARVQISSDSHFDNYDKIIIGNDVFINRFFHCSNEKTLIIKDRVMFGPECTIIGGDHAYNLPDENLRHTHLLGDNREIVIEEDAWIGHGTLILKRAFIGEGCIIGANSVVNSKLLPYSVYIGNPAKYIKPRFQTVEDLKKYLGMMKDKYGFESKYSFDELNKLYTKSSL